MTSGLPGFHAVARRPPGREAEHGKLQASLFGCGGLLITLGGLGLVSLFVDLGESNRAVWVIFIDMAKRSGSVPLFSILLILFGVLFGALPFLADAWRKGSDQ